MEGCSKASLPELSSGSSRSSGSSGNGAGRAGQDLGSPRAWGQDYVSYTNSLKSESRFVPLVRIGAPIYDCGIADDPDPSLLSANAEITAGDLAN